MSAHRIDDPLRIFDAIRPKEDSRKAAPKQTESRRRRKEQEGLFHSGYKNISRLETEVGEPLRKDSSAKINTGIPAQDEAIPRRIVKSRITSPIKAIWKHCSDCAGESPKEVTLCQIVDCPLWPFRLGYSIRDKRFLMRMLKAKANHPEDFAEVRELVCEYLINMPDSADKEQIGSLFQVIDREAEQ